ncbi:zinc finger protein OZF-like [Corythoichthys intestinalis]|uniref:zinc finger protein OZF-like n=1 Tax=Corythoichthys intestinalis TaxID=161448 RepID=UPI0025A538E0|nr:zinc finger protein OZF-like [Corythoichthys intestinalis]
MAESPGRVRRTFDFSESESEDDSEENVFKTAKKVLPGKQGLDAEKIKKIDRPSSAKDLSEDEVQDMYTIEYEIQEHSGTNEGQDTGSTSDPVNFRTVCKECGTSFSCKEMFFLHRHYHTHKDELLPLICEQCGLSFTDRCSLIRHKHTHTEEPKYVDEVRFQCASCETFFPTPQELRLHQCDDTDDKPYHCTLCRKEFQLTCAVAKHMLNHSQEGSWTCQECGKSFPDYRTLRCHQQCHAVLKTFECPKCNMTFTHRYIMEAHLSRHTKRERAFLCPICGKTFKCNSLLQEKARTNRITFCCPDCEIQLAGQNESTDED